MGFKAQPYCKGNTYRKPKPVVRIDEEVTTLETSSSSSSSSASQGHAIVNSLQAKKEKALAKDVLEMGEC